MSVTNIMAFRHNSKVADDEPKWSDVDKKELPRIAFADEGEEDKVSTWGYPHHWVKGGKEKDDKGRFKDGTLFLHEEGLNVAWEAANGARSGHEASEAVKAHLEAHRKALGKTDDSENRARGYDIRNQTPNSMDIYIYGNIGFEDWDGDGITAQGLAKDLQNAGPSLQTINLHINSPGGRVFEAVTIYNLLKQHKATVNVYIDGLAASSASVVAMAGNHIEMANNGILMIHKPWTWAVGNADDMRKEAIMLDKVEGAITQSYLNQCAKRGVKDMAEQLGEMMTAETWMSAEEALGYGLIDAIGEEMVAAASVSFDMAKFKYKNAPSGLLANGGTQRRTQQASQPVVVHNHITINQPAAIANAPANKPKGTPRLSLLKARLKLAENQTARSPV